MDLLYCQHMKSKKPWKMVKRVDCLNWKWQTSITCSLVAKQGYQRATNTWRRQASRCQSDLYVIQLQTQMDQKAARSSKRIEAYIAREGNTDWLRSYQKFREPNQVGIQLLKILLTAITCKIGALLYNNDSRTSMLIRSSLRPHQLAKQVNTIPKYAKDVSSGGFSSCWLMISTTNPVQAKQLNWLPLHHEHRYWWFWRWKLRWCSCRCRG